MARDSKLSDGATYQYVISPMPCQLYEIFATNAGSANRYLKVYNKATTPNPATDVPIARFPLFPNGGIRETFSESLAGLSFVIVTGAADTSVAPAAVNEVIVNVVYEPLS